MTTDLLEWADKNVGAIEKHKADPSILTATVHGRPLWPEDKYRTLRACCHAPHFVAMGGTHRGFGPTIIEAVKDLQYEMGMKP